MATPVSIKGGKEGLRLVLDEVGLKPNASWLIAEGADACRMQAACRS